MLSFGYFGDNDAACEQACAQQPLCMTYTLKLTTYADASVAGNCYGWNAPSLSDGSDVISGVKVDCPSESQVSEVDCPCMKNITQPTGTITSPGYPDGYSGRHDCGWLVHAKKGFIIELTFEPPFQVGSTSSLTTTATRTDRVEVYDGSRSTAPPLGRFSGGHPPPRMHTTGSDVFIRFVSTGSTTSLAGFTAKFRWVGLPVRSGGIMAGPYRGVGLSSRWVPDSDVTASSETPGYEAAQARLHNRVSISESRGWRPTSDNVGEWVKVTFPTKRVILGISTQGISGSTDCWIASYHVRYQYHGTMRTVLRTYLRRTEDPDFRGNFDADTVVTNMFSQPIVTDNVQVFPRSMVNHICLRFELLEPIPDSSTSINVVELSNGALCETGGGQECTELIDGLLGSVPGLWSPSGSNDHFRVVLSQRYIIHRVRIMQGNNPAARIATLKFTFSENGLSSTHRSEAQLEQRSDSNVAAMLWDDVTFPPDDVTLPLRTRFISVQVLAMHAGDIVQARITEFEIYTVPQEHETFCPPGWISKGSSCYFLSYEASIEPPDQLCSNLRPMPGVHPRLAELNSIEERSFLSGYATKIMEKTSVGADLDIVQVRGGCLATIQDSFIPHVHCSPFGRPYICEFNYKYDALPKSCREALDLARILGNYARYGIYQIRVKNRVLSVYCDMNRDGGGWTLLVTASTREGWEGHVMERHVGYPSVGHDYSILGFGDMIKDSFPGNKFHYRVEAGEKRHWGGVWEAPKHYSLVHSNPHQTDINILRRYGPWMYGTGSLGHRLPWVPNSPASPALLTTSTLADGNIPWGTLVAREPRTEDKNITNMIAEELSTQDMTVRYWIREQADIDELDCQEGYSRWGNGESCYRFISSRAPYGEKCTSYAWPRSKQRQDHIAWKIHGTRPAESFWIDSDTLTQTDNSNGPWLPEFPDSTLTENVCPYADHTKGYGWATTDCRFDTKSSLCEEGCKQIRSSGVSALTVAVTWSSTFTFYVKAPINGTEAWKLFVWTDEFPERYRIRKEGEEIHLARHSGGAVLNNNNTAPYNVFHHEDEYHKFWVRLANGKLSVGRGGELNPLVELEDPTPLQGPPWYISIKNVDEYQTDWKFCDLDPGYCTGENCKRSYREDCTDGTSYYTCPRNEPDSIGARPGPGLEM
ncbi:uncharacterized protein LOC118405041 [Branchiostoma floridae]|uniref:Uncharacterized protein LOC118405041 n=1 Tax=Branchiostoma floridae TaxID=7739 RepID=A0A9J7HL36_BRAFL|nr:uncharacterized protein LOC118405041 [Branchiostoma floridae]